MPSGKIKSLIEENKRDMTMQIRELFTKPLDRNINGVVKAEQLDEQSIWSELDEYVVTRELDRHFRHFFETYLPAITAPDDPSLLAALASGFQGTSALVSLTSSRSSPTCWVIAKPAQMVKRAPPSIFSVTNWMTACSSVISMRRLIAARR